jgi:DNA repair protein RAD7
MYPLTILSQTTGYASDNLDDPEEERGEEKPVRSSKKRKLSKTTEAKLKAKEKKKIGKKDSDDDDDEDAYTALSKSIWAGSTPKPSVGDFENCATCEKQFTVVSVTSPVPRLIHINFQTKYTIASSTGEGFLCHQCAKAGGHDPFKMPAAPRKRKATTEKRKAPFFQERRFPTLISLCVQVRPHLILRHAPLVHSCSSFPTTSMMLRHWAISVH